MSTKNVFKLLLDLSKAGRRANFFQVLDSYSLLKANPENISPRDISILINSFGYFSDLPLSNWRLMENYYHTRKEEMNVHDLTLTVWGFCQAGKHLHDSTWKSLESSTRKNLMTFSPKELSSICYSFAWSGYQSKQLWEHLKYAVVRQIFYMTSENVIPVIWAFSKLDIRDDKLWEILEKKVLLEIKNIDSKSHNVIVAGFSSVEKGSEDLWRLFERIFNENIENYSDKDINMLSNAFRKTTRGKEPRFGKNMMELLKEKSEDFSIGTIVSFGHTIRESVGTTAEFNELLFKQIHNEKKVQEMAYGHVMNCARLLFHSKLKDSEVWDILALRLRQLIRTHQGMDIKGHLYFIIRNTSYWGFVCEESFLYYFERVSKMEPAVREKMVRKEEYIDMITVSFLCFSQRIGSKHFWTQCGRFFMSKKIDASDLAPMQLSKFMKTISGRFFEMDGLRNYWFEYEYEICENLELLEKMMMMPKAFRLLAKSFMKMGRVENLLKGVEKVYKKVEIDDKEVSRFIEKTMTWKSDDVNMPKYEGKKIARVLEDYDAESRKEILHGIFEYWFNYYLGRNYEPRAYYLDIYERLRKEEDEETVISQEAQEKVSEEEEDIEDIKEEVEESKGEVIQGVKEKLEDFKMGSSTGLYEEIERNEVRDEENVVKMVL